MEILTVQSNTQNLRNVRVGKDVQIFSFVNAYECSIGDGSKVGAFTEIQKEVVIGRNCKISSHSFICTGVEMEDNVFIGHGVMFINDLFSEGGPAGGDATKWKSTFIGNHVSIGSNATILPVKICDHVVIGAGAVVTKDIDRPGIYAGNPARFIRSHVK